MEEKKKEALAAIESLFGDMSVSQADTLKALEEVQSVLATRISAIRDELEDE